LHGKIDKLPTISIINGVKIECFSADHPPPHVHVSYSGHEALVELIEVKVFLGNLPKMKLNLALEYIEENKVDLLKIFNALNPPNHRI